MGGSQGCGICCFIKKELNVPKETDPIVVSEPPENPDALSDSTGDEVVPAESLLQLCEREHFLSAIAEATDRFLRLIHEPINASFELTLEKDGCKVHTKESPTGVIVRAEWTVPFTPEVYLDFLSNDEKRQSWDSNIEEIKTIETVDSNVVLSYLRYKRILTMSPRDLVLVSKKFDVGSGFVNSFCSVDARVCPLIPDFVRANILTGGYYLEDLSQGPDVPLTRVLSYSDASCGISKTLMRKVTALNLPKLVKKMEEILRADLKSLAESRIVPEVSCA